MLKTLKRPKVNAQQNMKTRQVAQTALTYYTVPDLVEFFGVE